jgi:subtilisin family serine protease
VVVRGNERVSASTLRRPPEGDLPNAPATDADTLSGLQWDMRQIHAFEAHAITGGSPAVVVGDIDTGLDKDHPDLIPNIDFAKSVSCESGSPVSSPAAWDDHNGHGTHTAGTIAAARDESTRASIAILGQAIDVGRTGSIGRFAHCGNCSASNRPTRAGSVSTSSARASRWSSAPGAPRGPGGAS